MSIVKHRRVKPLPIRCPDRECHKLNGELWRDSTRWRLRVPNTAVIERTVPDGSTEPGFDVLVRVKRNNDHEFVTDYDLGPTDDRLERVRIKCRRCERVFPLTQALRSVVT